MSSPGPGSGEDGPESRPSDEDGRFSARTGTGVDDGRGPRVRRGVPRTYKED